MSNTKFLSLNDDCIRSIFNGLSCDDLCAFSGTCRRMLALGTECFKRNFSATKVVIFKHMNYRGLVIEPNGEFYTKFFAKHVQNVVLDGSMSPNLVKFINFYRQKQSNNETVRLEETIRFPIKNLTLHRWFFDKNEPCGPLLENMLHNIESLTLSDCETNGDLAQCLLQYMPNLKRLTLFRGFNDEECKKNELNDWMNQTYPNLEYFSSHLEYNQIPVDRIKRFQKVNPNVKISLLLPSLGDDLQTWIKEGVCMDELFILDSDDGDVEVLKAACQRKQINRLHLRIFLNYSYGNQNEHLAQLTLLAPYIEGIYFEGGYVQKEPAEFLKKIENLKILQADVTCNAALFGRLPKLEQLFITMNVDKRDKNHYSHQISRAINKASNLKEVFICGDDLSTLLKFSFRSLDSNHKIKFFVKPVKRETDKGYNNRPNRSNRPNNEISILRRLKKRSIRDEWTEKRQENDPIMIEVAHTDSEMNYNPIVGIPNFYT